MARQKGLAGGWGGGALRGSLKQFVKTGLVASKARSGRPKSEHTIRRSIYQALLTKRQKSTIITDKEFGK